MSLDVYGEVVTGTKLASADRPPVFAGHATNGPDALEVDPGDCCGNGAEVGAVTEHELIART